VLQHFEPRPWGKIGSNFLIDNPRAMLVEDPGMGKTSQVLWALEMLRLGGSNFFPAVVLAPKRVAEVVWDGERDKWDAFQDLSVIKVLGERDARVAALRQSIADIYVVNYDNVPWLVNQFPESKWPFKTVIADESSRLKGFRLSKGGVRAAALASIARFTGRWWNLTGTPIPNGLQDLWGQMWFVDFGERLKRTYTSYLSSYFIENPYTRNVSLQQGCEPIIYEQVKDRLIALRAEDWLDLDKPQEIPVEIQMPPEALKSYRAMEKDFFMQLPDADISAGTAATKSTKLLQLAAGSVWDTETGLKHAVHEARTEALQDIVEQTGGAPLLVAYWWKFDPERIMKAFPQARMYQGKREEDEFNAGKIPILLLHMQSAFGLSLHMSCRDIVFYSYYWNAELWQQFIERAGPVRQAQAGFKRIVRVWQIKARGTVDQDVIDSNAKKISVEQAFKRARARVRGDT
jgi:SNF2 family DNA or RNA helicase